MGLGEGGVVPIEGWGGRRDGAQPPPAFPVLRGGGMQQDGAGLDTATAGECPEGRGSVTTQNGMTLSWGVGCLRWDPFTGTGLTPPLSAQCR